MKNLACKINGKLWSVIFKSLGGAWGFCDHDKRQIQVEQHASDKMKMDAIIHEMAHASFPYLTEEAINGFGTDVARLLYRLGWRVEQ